jgi:hypothetical protein
VRQLGATIGVALTIAFLSGIEGPAAALARFDRTWWLTVATGLVVTALALPLRTAQGGSTDGAARRE